MNQILTVARDAAQAAAEILSGHFQDLSSVTMDVKSTGEDGHYDGIVTSADLAAEQAIVAKIQSTFPDHTFLAEEQFADSSIDPGNVEHLWVIDPLDGTNNFAHGLEHYAVSVAYYRRGVAECGVVMRPESDDLYWARRGEGAWHQRGQQSPQQIRVNRHQRLDQSMVGVGFYYDRGQMMRDTLQSIERLFEQQVHGVRRFGTAALDIILVARGSFGAFFEYQLSPWDFAASRLLIEEAGGRITTCDGQELPLATTSVLATNGLLHAAMLEQVKR